MEKELVNSKPHQRGSFRKSMHCFYAIKLLTCNNYYHYFYSGELLNIFHLSERLCHGFKMLLLLVNAHGKFMFYRGLSFIWSL